MFSELAFLLCQNRRGDVVPSSGDDWNGDESVFNTIFCHSRVSWCDLNTLDAWSGRCLTFVDWFQLGELRRFSIGEISDNGRGSPLAPLLGDGIVLLLVRRRG